MTTQKSLSNLNNKATFLGNYRFLLKRNIGILIINFILGFISSSVFFIIKVTEKNNSNNINYINPINMMILHLFICGILAVLIAFVIFSYMFNRRAVDVYHSIPISRKNLFLSNFLAGYTILMVPIIVNILICLSTMPYLTYKFLDIKYLPFFTMVKIFVFGVTFIYAVVVFIMVNCGTVFESLVYTAMFNLIPTLFLVAIIFASRSIFIGMERFDNILSEISVYTTPILGILFSAAQNDIYNNINIICFSIIIWVAIFVIGGVVLYKRRKSESAGSPFAFKSLYNILSVLSGITIGIGIFLSGLFGYNQNALSVVMGFVFGIISFIVLESITSRGFKIIIKSLKKALTVSAVFGAIILIASLTQGFGFVKRVPNANSIKSVEIQMDQANYYMTDVYGISFTSQKGIATVLNIHNDILKNIDESIKVKRNYNGSIELNTKESNKDIIDINIKYKFKNGLTQVRNYQSFYISDVNNVYEIMKSQEYRDQRYFFTRNKIKDAKYTVSIESVNNQLVDMPVTIDLNDEQKNVLFDALIKDIKVTPPEQTLQPKSKCIATILLQSNESHYPFSEQVFIYENYKNSIPILKSLKLLDTMKIIPQRITFVDKKHYNNYDKNFYSNNKLHLSVFGSTTDYNGFLENEAYETIKNQEKIKQFVNAGLLNYVQPYYYSQTPCSYIITDYGAFIVPPENEKKVKNILNIK